MTWPGFLDELFSSRFMPHGHCYLWTPGLVWLHAVSDGLVALSYTSIPFTLLVFARRRRDIPFNWMFLCFALFIIACGATHYLEIWTLWHGTYWLSGLVKAITAAASVPTAFLLVRLLPGALAIPHPAALRESEARFRAVLDGSLDAFFLLRAARDDTGTISDFIVTETNARGERVCGLPRDRMIGRRISELFPAAHVAAVLPRYVRVVDTGTALGEEFQYVPGDPAFWEHQLVPVEDGLAVSLRDITDRKRAEKTRARLAAIIESTDDAVYSRALDGSIETWNAAAERLYGYTAEEILGQPAAQLRPRHVGDDVPSGASIERSETLRVRKNGTVVEVALTVSPIENGGALAGHAVIARDITLQKTAERQIKGSLREKEVLLKEVHHRVKNNLQVISSLLNLQAAKIRDAEALDMFRESQDRVRSIAFFHEHLYQSKDLARVDLASYLRTLADHLLASYGASRTGVVMQVTADENVRLGVDKAIPCGLIVNELVSNALKHGFREGETGTISVLLRATSFRDLSLVVADDGVGLPGGYTLVKAGTLGHQLVLTLVRQLGGHIDIANGRGVRFEISFGQHMSGENRAFDLGG